MGKWTDDQLQYLREHSRSQPAAAIAAALGRTEGSVRQKRRSLGLQSYHAGWTKAEEQFLQDQWGVMSIPAIAKRLNRSVEAVIVRKNRLGLGPVLFGGDYISMNQLTTVNMVYHAGYSRWDLKKEMTIPEDASDVRYFYRKDSTGITLYKERQELQQPDPEAEAREERRRRDEQAENEFAEAAEAHFELRKDFIKELPNSVFKQHMKEIALFCVATTESIDGGYCNSINPRLCAQLLGMRLSPDDENEDFCDMGFVRSAAEAQPEKLIFCACYSAIDANDESYYDSQWNMGEHQYVLCENSQLDRVYDVLEVLGYEKSDDEEAMADGTHRLFAEYGAPEDDSEDSDDE